MICKFYNDELLQARQNVTCQWTPSDTEEVYLPTNGDTANYSPTDVNYIFNSHGFRSDELTSPADLEILFMGCSFTEGIGLPLAEVWPTLLLNKIRGLPQFVDKQIPFKTIAVGGAGIDNQSRFLHKYIDFVKPTYIFFGFPHLYRREYNFSKINGRNWIPSANIKHHSEQMIEIMIDDNYATAATYRGFLLLDALSQKYNTKVFIFHDSNSPDTNRLMQIIDQVGGNLKNVLLPWNMQCTSSFDFHAWTRATQAPPTARDNLHPGAFWQYRAASRAWDLIKHEFDVPRMVQNKQVTK